MQRLESFKRLETQLQKIEENIAKTTMAEGATPETLQTQFDMYERLTKIQISYIDTLRKLLAQIDLNEYLRTFGLIELYSKFQHMTPDSIKRIQEFIDVQNEAPETE